MPGYTRSIYNFNATRSQNGYKFNRVFRSFGPSTNGWKYCRPILDVDGTFLSKKYKGYLLITNGVDTNKGMYPLAFAILEESITSWQWFFSCISRFIPTVNSRQNLCIIYDWMAGILNVVEFEFPYVAHRFCLWHIHDNFHKKFNCVELYRRMWLAGSTSRRFNLIITCTRSNIVILMPTTS